MKRVEYEWFTFDEKKPKHEDGIIIAINTGEVLEVEYYKYPGDEEVLMNDCDQEWSLEEVDFWMPVLKHPTKGVS